MVFMFKGLSNWAPYLQFHFGEEGGLNWAPYWQLHFGEGVHLQVGWKSIRFTDSDWLSTLL